MPRAWSRVHSTHLALHRFSPTPSSLQHRPSVCETEPPAQLCSRGCYGHGVPSCFGHAHPPPRPRPAGHFERGRGASPPVGLSALPPPPPQLGPISPAGWPGFSSAQPAPRPRPPSATSLFPVPAVALTEAASPTSAPGGPAHPGLPGIAPPTSGGAAPPPGRPAPPTPPASGGAARPFASPSRVRLRLPRSSPELEAPQSFDIFGSGDARWLSPAGGCGGGRRSRGRSVASPRRSRRPESGGHEAPPRPPALALPEAAAMSRGPEEVNRLTENTYRVSVGLRRAGDRRREVWDPRGVGGRG